MFALPRCVLSWFNFLTANMPRVQGFYVSRKHNTDRRRASASLISALAHQRARRSHLVYRLGRVELFIIRALRHGSRATLAARARVGRADWFAARLRHVLAHLFRPR